MHIRTSLLGLAILLASAPTTALACGGPGLQGNAGVMMTPVSARGRFVYINKVSRRTLRHAVAEQKQQTRVEGPLPREIL